MMAYYKNTLQRFMYAWGNDKIFLGKNVISTGRIEMLLETFPDAKIIYPIRSPYNTIPSMVSMFSAPYSIIAPDIPENSPEYRAWGELLMAFYVHFTRVLDEVDLEHLYVCHYDDLIKDPLSLIKTSYEQFGFEYSTKFDAALRSSIKERKSYRSKHSYSLEKYGFNKAEINLKLAAFFKKYPHYLESDD